MLTRYDGASTADLSPTLRGWDWGGGRGLLLHGPKGTGKTHAAVALWRDYQDRYPSQSVEASASFVSVARLFKEKRAAMDKKETKGWVEPDWKRVRFVVFDDWDKARWSEWVAEEMFSIIDTLYCRMIPVIVTSNHTPREFARLSGEFITDRIKEMCVPIEMGGASRRRGPNVSHNDQEPDAGNGLLPLPSSVEGGASHQSELVAGTDGAFTSERPAQDGVGHRGSSLSQSEYEQAEARLHLLVGNPKQSVAV